MIIKKLIFNPFQTNTYIITDETNECIIIDAACYGDKENKILEDYITKENLIPVRTIFTHCHIDHILGKSFVIEKYNLEPEVHPKGQLLWETVKDFGFMFGFNYDQPLDPKKFIKEGDIIKFGNSSLKVIYTPGHADGSISLWSKKENFVIVGDVLFNKGVGRTDLPTGNLELLRDSIFNKLFILDDDTIVYSGHGSKTTIGSEKNYLIL